MSDASDATRPTRLRTTRPPNPPPHPPQPRSRTRPPAPATSPVVRYEWGPDVGAYNVSAPEGTKADVELVFVAVDPVGGTVHLEVPAHDPAKQLVPARVHLLCYAPGSHPHAIASDAIAAAQGGDPAWVDVAVEVVDPAVATPVTIPRPTGVRPGVEYTGKTVAEFHDAPAA